MSFPINDAVRADVRLLILLAGGTGAGKTESAMRLATGLAGVQPFAVIDTENGRALHKADDYAFKHIPFEEPFTPERFAEAVKTADDAGFPVIVVDSGSHEYDGTGGVLDIQQSEFKRLGSRDSAKMLSWVEPKTRHKRFVQQLLRTRAHVILCLRAEDKVEMGKDDKGKTVVREKASLIGVKGWIPIVEKRLPFEATISLMLLQDNPGVPVPVKLERRHEELIFTDVPLDEATGERLAAWAKGSGAAANGVHQPEAGEPATDAASSSAPRASGKDAAPKDGAAPLLSDGQRDRVQELIEMVGLNAEQLFATAARDRNVNVDTMISVIGARDDAGRLHWTVLRDSLTAEEADSWIARLEAKLPTGAAA